MFTKMDKIWVVIALQLHPDIHHTKLVSLDEIRRILKYNFDTEITPIMLTHHLVSWIDRQADRTVPARGGSRNRYLFRSEDGLMPSETGNFRLYKAQDARFDGWDKTGKVRPEPDAIPPEFHHLLDWHQTTYFGQ